ncbi:MAG: hypothetical protein U0232_02060 [Thermomicrobiales bacterium]
MWTLKRSSSSSESSWRSAFADALCVKEQHPQLLVDRWQLGRFYAAVAVGDYKAAARYSEASEEEIARWAARGRRATAPSWVRIRSGETCAFAVAQHDLLSRALRGRHRGSNGLNVFHGDPLPLPGPTVRRPSGPSTPSVAPAVPLEFVDAQALDHWVGGALRRHLAGRSPGGAHRACREGEDVYPPAGRQRGAPLRSFVPLRLS